MRVLVLCLVGMILGAGGLVCAEEAGEQCGHKGKHGKKFLAKYDKDGDGELSEEERVAAKGAWMLKRYDKDGDGTLSEEENTSAQEAKKKWIARFDKDGDGKLSGKEKKAMRKAHGGKWRHHGNKKHGGCTSA